MHTKTKTKNTLKVLVSLIIAFAMVGVPATVFTANAQPTEYDFDLEAQEPPLETGCEELINITFESPEYIGNVIYHAILKDTEMSAIGDIMVEYTDSEPGTWYSPDMYMDGNDTVIVVDPMGGSQAPFDPGVSNLTVNVTFCEADTYDVEMVVYNETNMVKKYDEMFTLDVEDGFDMTVQVNGNDPDGTTFPDVVLLVDTVNITADFNATCATVTSAHVYFTAQGSVSGGEATMDQAADGTWYWQSAQDPLVNGWTVGEWEFQINATTDGPCDPWVSGTYNFTVVEDETDPAVEVEFGDPSYVGPNPEPWHDMDGPISGDSDATWINCTTPIIFNATDPEGITTVHFRMWNFTHGWGEWDSGIETSITDYFVTAERGDECKHKIEYYAEDASGDFSETYFTYFYVDCTPPTCEKTYSPAPCEGINNGEDYVANTTTITLECDDGEWDLQNKSCPSGVDYINYSFDDDDETTYTEPFTLEGLDPGEHLIEIWAYDNVSNEFYFNQTFIICEPPTVEGSIEETDYWHGDTPKYALDDEIDFTADVGTCDENVTIENVTIQIEPAESSDYYVPGAENVYTFDMVYNDATGQYEYTFTNTSVAGEYKYTIIAEDCTGQTGTYTGTFILLCERDVDVTKIVKPEITENGWVDSSPTEVWVEVTNNGLQDITECIDLHLQVYEEQDIDPQVMWFDDMEYCCANWTAKDVDGDGCTWDRSTNRAYSGEYSWRNIDDCIGGGTYVGNSHDQLISKEIEITDVCNGQSPQYLWIDFMQWIQGEDSVDQGKYEDYGNVYYRLDDGDWILLARYLDSNGEWVSSDPDAATSIPYGTYDYTFDGEPIGWRVPIGDAESIELMFEWRSDPCTQYEGWYIDDVKIMAQCGGLQPLVDQGYKYLCAGLEQGETKLVSFPLEFTPEEDTWYFIEVYSSLDGDCDGLGDDTGDGDYDIKETTLAGPLEEPRTVTYRDPVNGVNESFYFGDVHDGQADDICWDVDDPMVQLTGGTEDIPIVAHVSNQGTVTEPIPYTIEVKETMVEYLMRERVEKGDTDYYTDPANWDDNPWTIGYFDNPDAIDWGVSDFKASSPTHAWYAGVAVGDAGFYSSDQWNFLRPPYVDLTTYMAQDIDVGMAMDMTWSLDPTLNPGYKGHFAEAGDAVIFGTWDPVNDVYMHLSSTEVTGYQPWKTFNIEEIYGMYGGYSDTGEVTTMNELYSAHKNIMALSGYADPDGKIAPFFAIMTDDGGIGAPGQGWGGFVVDDINTYVVATGDTVWSTEGVTETLEPGEVSDDIEVTWTAENYSDYTATITTTLENDWNTGLKGDQNLGHLYNDEATTWDCSPGNIYLHDIVYTEDFEATEFTPEWSIHDNTFGEDAAAYWQVCDNGKTGWQQDHYVWTGDGPLSAESSYMASADYVLMPKADDGGIWTFNPLKDDGCDIMEMNFELWNEIETDWDYLTLEISNDSGQNWFIIDQWNNLTNPEANMETWQDVSIELFNGTDYIEAYNHYQPPDPYGFYPAATTQDVNVGLTENMTFRFHMLSDGAYQYKGAYIDDITLGCMTNETLPYDGTDQNWEWTSKVIFEEDFESGTLDNWFNIEDWTGSTWHVSDTCSYTGDHSAANSDPYPYSSYNKHLEDSYYDYSFLGLGWYGPLATNITYDHSYMNYRNNADDKLILDLDLSGVYQAWLQFYTNYTFADMEDYVAVEVSTDGGDSWLEISRYMGDSGGWIEETAVPPLGFDLIDNYKYGIDLTPYAGAPIKLRFRTISDGTGVEAGFQIDDIQVTGKRDNEAPVTTAILNPASPDGCNGWYTGDVTITLTATDNIEMDETYYRINGGTWLKYTGPITIDDDGEYTIDYYSTDAYGNEESYKTVTFKIDGTAPTGSLDFPQTGYIYLFGNELMPRIIFKDKALIIGGLVATASVSDATSGMGYVTFTTSEGGSVNVLAPYEYNLPFYFPFGSDTLTISATDLACNTATDLGSVDYMKIL